MRAALFAAALICAAPALAHDEWANGQPVPAWVKQACCGPADAHHLRPDQVIQHDDGYYTIEGVEGFPETIRIGTQVAIPSQDGSYWLFFGPGYNGPNVYCFFAPLDF